MGMEALWAESDLVIKINFVILLCMSIATWSVVFAKIKTLGVAKKIQNELPLVRKQMQTEGVCESSAGCAKNQQFHSVLLSGLEALAYYNKNSTSLLDGTSPSEWFDTHIQISLKQVKANLSKKLSLLASIGSTAPFIGLFGTVWGIYLALIKIGETGSASIDQVAGPIGEALIMTAFGLAVAIPAVLAFNLFNRTNNKILFELINFSKELKMYMMASVTRDKVQGK